jgi:hypothetical protein
MRELTMDTMAGGLDTLSMEGSERDRHSVDPITMGLMNEDTERNLAFIDKLHNLGVSKYIGLPQVRPLLFKISYSY